MTQTIEYKQHSHLDPALSDPATRTLSAHKVTGRWLNTNRETGGIAECVIEQIGEQFEVTLVGVGAGERIDWPIAKVQALANLEEEAGQRAVALAPAFDFGFMKSETYIRVNKGVLVIVLFNMFQDDSGRSNYLNREFFYRPD